MLSCGPSLFRSPRPVIGGGGGPTDPYNSSVVARFHFDETAGSTTYVDTSPILNNMVNTAGTQTSSAQSVFGGLSLNVDTTAGRRATTTLLAAYNFGSADFTIEFAYRVAVLATENIFDMRAGFNGKRATIYTLSTGALVYFMDSLDRVVSAASAIAANTWYRIAYDRVNIAGTFTGRLYKDGAVLGSWTDNVTYDTVGATPSVMVPSHATPSQNAFYDELRITNGVARYQGAYTPAVAAFPDS